MYFYLTFLLSINKYKIHKCEKLSFLVRETVPNFIAHFGSVPVLRSGVSWSYMKEYIHIMLCAYFHAFRMKWTIISLNCSTTTKIAFLVMVLLWRRQDPCRRLSSTVPIALCCNGIGRLHQSCFIVQPLCRTLVALTHFRAVPDASACGLPV